MHIQKKILHVLASLARGLHLWPFIARSGLFNRARRRKYPDTIVHLDVVITECCTLRCRDCSNLMQYYHKPENLDAEEMVTCLRRLLASVKVNQLKLLGGEPFVCQKSLIRILEYLRDETDGRVNEIDIITNGTIVPSEETLNTVTKDPRIKIVFSNYGELSSRLEELSSICDNKGIRYEIVNDDFWWDFGDLRIRDEKQSKTQHRYDGCYSRRLCTTLYRGKLYICPRQAHAINLGIIPEVKDEIVDVKDPLFDDPSALHKAVDILIDRRECISTCKRCGCDSGKKVSRAVQAERPINVS